MKIALFFVLSFGFQSVFAQNDDNLPEKTGVNLPERKVDVPANYDPTSAASGKLTYGVMQLPAEPHFVFLSGNHNQDHIILYVEPDASATNARERWLNGKVTALYFGEQDGQKFAGHIEIAELSLNDVGGRKSLPIIKTKGIPGKVNPREIQLFQYYRREIHPEYYPEGKLNRLADLIASDSGNILELEKLSKNELISLKSKIQKLDLKYISVQWAVIYESEYQNTEVSTIERVFVTMNDEEIVSSVLKLSHDLFSQLKCVPKLLKDPKVDTNLE